MEEKQSLDCAGFLTEKWVFDTANTGPMFDASGVSFAGVREALGPRRFWQPRESRKDKKLLRLYHAEMSRCSVPGCTGFGPLEVHHLIGGRGGRSDERANLLPLCRTCHEWVNTPLLPFNFLLWLKFELFPEEVSWSRLTLLHGRWLPDPVRPRSKL